MSAGDEQLVRAKKRKFEASREITEEDRERK